MNIFGARTCSMAAVPERLQAASFALPNLAPLKTNQRSTAALERFIPEHRPRLRLPRRIRPIQVLMNIDGLTLICSSSHPEVRLRGWVALH